MAILDFFLSRNKNTASIAKARLQIIISKKRKNTIYPEYFMNLKKEIFTVICKYVKISTSTITIKYDKKKKKHSILKLNIILPN